MEKDKLLIYCDKQEVINEILQPINRLTQMVEQLNDKLNRSEKVYTINQLIKQGTIGKYTKITNLIKSGKLATTKDGKISQVAINEYLNTKNK